MVKKSQDDIQKYNVDALTLIYQSDINRYQTVMDSDHAMDSKNGVLLAGVLAITVFIFPVDLRQIYNMCFLNGLLLVQLFVFGVIAILGALTVSIIAIWPRPYNLPSHLMRDKPKSNGTEYGLLDRYDITEQSILDIEDAISKIEQRQKIKADMFKVGLVLFTVAVIVLMLVKQIIL